jgi:hypothetical protein
MAAAAVAFVLAVVVIDRLTPEPSGPASSSFATVPEGLAAYADLLRRAGHPVSRRQEPLSDGARLAPASTLIVLDPRVVAPEEARAIGAFVRAGGRLIAGGTTGTSWLESAFPDAPTPGGRGTEMAQPTVPVPETSGVGSVLDPVEAAWDEPGSGLPVLGAADAPLAVVASEGRGRAVLLASAAPLQNRALARADNAAFGVAAAGGSHRPVTFLETVHGYGGDETGLAALPDRVLWALLGLLLAGGVFAWSHARRIGPPEDEERPLPPARADYVDALAGALTRTRRPVEVARPLHAAARERLASRAGLPAGADDDELREAGTRFGLDEDEIRALVTAPVDRDGALAAGRAYSKLEGVRT